MALEVQVAELKIRDVRGSLELSRVVGQLKTLQDQLQEVRDRLWPLFRAGSKFNQALADWFLKKKSKE